MTFLLPDPRPRMRCKYTHGRGSVDVSRLCGVHLDAAQVFGADEAVLPRADQSAGATDRWPSRPPKTRWVTAVPGSSAGSMNLR